MGCMKQESPTAEYEKPIQFAKRIGCSRRHVNNLVSQGIVPHCRPTPRLILIPIDRALEALRGMETR